MTQQACCCGFTGEQAISAHRSTPHAIACQKALDTQLHAACNRTPEALCTQLLARSPLHTAAHQKPSACHRVPHSLPSHSSRRLASWYDRLTDRTNMVSRDWGTELASSQCNLLTEASSCHQSSNRLWWLNLGNVSLAILVSRSMSELESGLYLVLLLANSSILLW